MKLMKSSLVSMLALVISTPAMAFDRSSLPKLPSFERNNDLDLQDDVALRFKLKWAQFYLAELEMNNRAQTRVNTPETGINGRTSWAVGKSFLDAGIAAAVLGVAYKVYDQSVKAVETLKGTTVLSQQVKSSEAQSALRKVQLVPRKGRAANVAAAAAHRDIQTASLTAELAKASAEQKKAFKVAFDPRSGAIRGVVYTIAAGVTIAVLTDMGVTWYQTRNENANIEETRANLREEISFLQQRLAGQDENTARVNASANR